MALPPTRRCCPLQPLTTCTWRCSRQSCGTPRERQQRGRPLHEAEGNAPPCKAARAWPFETRDGAGYALAMLFFGEGLDSSEREQSMRAPCRWLVAVVKRRHIARKHACKATASCPTCKVLHGNNRRWVVAPSCPAYDRCMLMQSRQPRCDTLCPVLTRRHPVARQAVPPVPTDCSGTPTTLANPRTASPAIHLHHSNMSRTVTILVALVAVLALRGAVAVTVRASTRPPKNIKRPPQFILFR